MQNGHLWPACFSFDSCELIHHLSNIYEWQCAHRWAHIIALLFFREILRNDKLSLLWLYPRKASEPADLWSSTSWRFVPFKDTVYVIPSSSARLRKQLDVFVSFLGELSLYFIMLYRQNLATVLTQNSARPGDLLWYAFQSHVIVAF